MKRKQKQKVSRRHRKQTVPRFNPQYSRKSATKPLPLSTRLRRLFISTVAVSVFGTACFWLLFASIEIEGAPDGMAEEEVVSPGPVFLPLFDTPALVDEIKGNYPAEIGNVSIRHEWWHRRLVVEVERRQAKLILNTQGQSLGVDIEGVVTGTIEDGREDLPVLTDTSNLTAETGERAIPARLAKFVTGLDDSGFEGGQLRIIDTASELYSDLDAGYTVRFATDKSLEVQLENLSRVQQIAADKGDSINEYVDLRIPFKAYYR